MTDGAIEAPAINASAVDAPRRRSLMRWFGRARVGNKLTFGLFIVAIMSGVATYAAMTHDAPFGDPRTLVRLLTLDLILLIALVGTIAPRIVSIWSKRRQGVAGAQLQVKFVTWFSALAIGPAIFVTIFSVGFFYLGVESWFSDQVRTAIDESVVVANGYLDEHKKSIRGDIQAMAGDLAVLPMNTPDFNRVFQAEIFSRSLSDAVIFDGATGRVMAVSGFVFAFGWTPPPITAIEAARRGEVEVMSSPDQDNVIALVKLYGDVFLYVARRIDPLVIDHTKAAKAAAQRYTEAEGTRSSLQITVALAFGVVTLLLLLVAVWLGLHFANQLVRPIGDLIEAAERARAGDLTAQVREPDASDEVSILSRAFNRMTRQLMSQRSELVEANRQLDMRRRFTETVLAGVSAGVLGLDLEGRITLANRTATEFLSEETDGLVGRTLTEILPEIAPLLGQLTPNLMGLIQSQFELRRPGLPHRTLLVRVTAEQQGRVVRGYVATFDDVTELLQAQRKAAWADVARRIAHEIKNPLTPIQLAAERLKRKYLKEITSDPQTFQACTDTIVRQVGDIGRMVDEFSAFARMPQPVIRKESLSLLVEQSVFLQSEARPEIDFKFEKPDHPLHVECDGRQMTQALTNLLQNAVDAIEGRFAEEGEVLPRGQIEVELSLNGDRALIAVCDNGRGLPEAERDRLTEPYVTTRQKGTGLGLAIVKKIMEDHSGRLEMHDRPGGGARVVLVIPIQQAGPAEPVSPPRVSAQSLYGA